MTELRWQSSDDRAQDDRALKLLLGVGDAPAVGANRADDEGAAAVCRGRAALGEELTQRALLTVFWRALIFKCGLGPFGFGRGRLCEGQPGKRRKNDDAGKEVTAAQIVRRIAHFFYLRPISWRGKSWTLSCGLNAKLIATR